MNFKRGFAKKTINVLVVVVLVISLGLGTIFIASANPISGTGTDFSSQVNITDWAIINSAGNQVSDTVGVSGVISGVTTGNSQRHLFSFDWNLAPSGVLLQGGDYFRLPMPTMDVGQWRSQANFDPVDFLDDNGVVVGQWQVRRDTNEIIVVFNDNINNSASITGSFNTASNALQAESGGNWGLTQNVTFGGITQSILFPIRSALSRSPGGAGVSSSKTGGAAPAAPYTARWEIHVGSDAYAHLRLNRGETHLPQEDVLIIDELNHRFVPGSFGVELRRAWTYSLTPPNAGRRTSANTGTGITSHFEQIPHNGETFDDFLALVQSNQLQWGVYQGAHSDTLIIYLGNVNTATSRHATHLGSPLTYSLIGGANFASTRATSNLNLDGFIDATYEELVDFYNDTFGDNNSVGGQVQWFRFHFNEQYPALYAGTQVSNTARVHSNGDYNDRTGSANIPIDQGGTTTPVAAESARVVLRDYHDNFMLPGATFRLEHLNGENWTEVPNGLLNNTISDEGFLDTTVLAPGTYRFAQLTQSTLHPSAYNLPASNVGTGGVVNSLPVSTPFTITAGGQGQILNMTNIRFLRTVSFEAGAGGNINPTGAAAAITVPHGNIISTEQIIPTATPNVNFNFLNWTSSQHDGTFANATDIRALTITADTTFTANFLDYVLPVAFIVSGDSAHNSGSLTGQVLLEDAPQSHVVGWSFSSFSGYIATTMVQTGGHLELSQIPEPIADEGYVFAGWRPWLAHTEPTETLYIAPGGTLPAPIGSETGNMPDGTGTGSIGNELFSTEALTEFRNILGRNDEFISWGIIFIAYFTPEHNINFVAGEGGSISPEGNVATLTVLDGLSIFYTQTIPTPTPNQGFEFSHWTSSQHEGAFSTADDIRELTITADTTFTAHFTPTMITVTFLPGANGTLNGETIIEVSYGTILTVDQIPAVIANQGWSHTGWANENPLGFTVTESVTFTAQYTEIDDNGNGDDDNGNNDGNGNDNNGNYNNNNDGNNNDSDGKSSPITGDFSSIALWSIIALTSATGIIVLAIIAKKKNKTI